MNYYQFNAEDLAADDYFKEWVCSPTADTEAFWTTFLREYPERYYQVEEARRLVSGLRVIQRQPHELEQVETIWNRVEHTLDRSRPVPVIRRFIGQRGWQIAALLLLTLGIGWFKHQQVKTRTIANKEIAQAKNEWIETLNEASQLMQIQLADGSRVDLQRGGRLRYRKGLVGTQREVYLIGEAFFDVKKNPQKPFIVYANGLVTKVLGTSFRVRAMTNSPTVTVDVKTGRVSVYPNQPSRTRDPESTGMVLTPNQKVIFQRDEATLNKVLVDKPVVLISKKELQHFEFDDAPVAQVFGAIKRAYGVDVVYDEEVMAQCTLTLSLDDEDLFQKLNVICKVLDAQYKLIDAQIVIYSRGCSKSN